MPGGLGRRAPEDFTHVENHRIRGVLQADPATITVNRTLALPWWHWQHDQGAEGSCVGHGKAMTMAVVNTKQNKAAGARPQTVRYNPWWIWDRAKERDPWPDTNPGDDNGTSVDAACQVAYNLGLVPYDKRRKELPAALDAGISAYRWATDVDEMRTAIAGGAAITIGVDWYENFDRPEKVGNEWWIGKGGLGNLRGGHCVCVYGASDRREAFRLKNSWGKSYPLVWLPYETMQVLLDDYGEAAIITDR